MPFEKGHKLATGGKPKTKIFTDQLKLVLNEDDGPSKKKKLRRVAEKLVAAALEGEGWAIKEIADRVEGKPAQVVQGDEDAPLFPQVIKVEIVDSNT